MKIRVFEIIFVQVANIFEIQSNDASLIMKKMDTYFQEENIE
jgi:hypothetical protein